MFGFSRRFVPILMGVGLAFGTACETGASVANAVGANHLGVLWPGSQMEFSGGWVRPHPGPFIWGLVERDPGDYNWREPDLTVRRLQGQQLAILVTVWPFASWDQKACHTAQARASGAFREFGNLLYMPCDLDAYLAWITAAVERYDGDGVDDMPGLAYPIRHWEILNEPEMQGPELCFFQETPSVYAELLASSYDAVKAADPTAVVLPAGQSGMHWEATDYWRPILVDPKVRFDLANVHSIRCSDIQEDGAFWAAEYTQFLVTSGRGGTPYWITEAQVGRIDQEGSSEEDRDARDLFIGTVVAFGEGADVIFHVLANDPRGEKDQRALETFNLLGRTIGEFESAERMTSSSVRFAMRDGHQVYALWDDAKLPDEVSDVVKVSTYLGEDYSTDARGVAATVPLLVRTLRVNE